MVHFLGCFEKILMFCQFIPTEQATLVIPERSLEYGIYLLRFYSRVWDEDEDDPNLTHRLPFERYAFTYIRIKPTPLQAAMVDGAVSLVSRGEGQTLTLRAEKFSQDPDYPDDGVRTRNYFI